MPETPSAAQPQPAAAPARPAQPAQQPPASAPGFDAAKAEADLVALQHAAQARLEAVAPPPPDAATGEAPADHPARAAAERREALREFERSLAVARRALERVNQADRGA